MNQSRRITLIVLAILVAAILLTGCGAGVPASTDIHASPTETSPPPSPTPIPAAAWIYGEPILLADYLAEIARFEDAQAELGIDLASLEAYPALVLDALIEQRLLAEGARGDGLSISTEELEQIYQQILVDQGGEAAFSAWLEANHYQEGTFLAALEEDLLAGRMVEQITAGVGQNTEQVHARHILVSDRDLAESLQQQLQSGGDFASLAAQYSQDFSTRINGGDLGWFARGTLTMPSVEEAAFSLELNVISDVLQSDLGYHLLEVLEKEERELSPQSWQYLREQAVLDWLEQAKENAGVEVVSDPG
ncbi:MAG: peptidylprolyl isomerase [Anaerolineales bacterium]|nr:peptidylprolyl isomerase [Anaerolineales bacterium]